MNDRGESFLVAIEPFNKRKMGTRVRRIDTDFIDL